MELVCGNICVLYVICMSTAFIGINVHCVSEKKTFEYILTDNLNTNRLITMTFGTCIPQTMGPRQMVSHFTSLV